MRAHGRLRWLLLATILGLADSVLITSLVQNKSVSTGHSVQFTCSVANQQRHSVLWWFINHNHQLTRDDHLLSDASNKYSIVRPHDSDGVYILHISNVQASDVGQYKCEVENSNLQQVHTLSIRDSVPTPTPASTPNVNYTGCCQSAGVNLACLPVCSPTTLDLNTFKIAVCATDLHKVLKCVADGSNHLPCCRQRHVPTQCLGMCLGNTPSVLNSAYAVCLERATDIVACYEEGYHLLPSAPTELNAYSVGRSVIMTWKVPARNPHSVIGYRVYYQERMGGSPDFRSTAILQETAYVLSSLKYNTYYRVQVVAVNHHGSSLPSYSIELYTDAEPTPPDQVSEKPPITPSELLQCCVHRGVTNRCQPFLCDGQMSINMMPPECLLQLDKLLVCLAGERNHSPCCARRGVPAPCMPLCGNSTMAVTFELLACLPTAMPQIVSCFFEGQGIIPGAPRRLRETRVTSTSCDLQWDSPKQASLVLRYVVEFRKRADGGDFSELVTRDTRTTLVDLKPDTVYEVQVLSVGANGTSLPSVRLVFTTYPLPTANPPTTSPQPTESPQNNVTACCMVENVTAVCLNYCSYRADFTSSIDTALPCIPYLHIALKCGADNRDHTRCCRSSGIARNCLKFCAFSKAQAGAYMIHHSDRNCITQIPRIVSCMHEGIGLIPSPPHSLRVSNITEFSMRVDWSAPDKLSQLVDGYLVQYRGTIHHREPWTPKKTTSLSIILQNLRSNEAYAIRVSAYNADGESMPSEIITESTLQQYKAVNFTPAIDVGECCLEQNVSVLCLPGCRSQTVLNYHQCDTSLPAMLQCAANDRDHTACCIQESVHYQCLALCKGKPLDTASISILCAMHTQQLLNCFHEGMPTLPSPPRSLMLKEVTTSSVRLAWLAPAKNADGVTYTLHYEWRTAAPNWDREESWVNEVTSPHLVNELQASTGYNFYLTACNSHGCSAPSSAIRVTTIAKEAPVVSISQSPSGVVHEGTDRVTLTCTATGSPVPSVYWLRRHLRRNVTELTLTGVTRVDAGRYTCVAVNENGATDSKDLHMQVSYKPSVEVPYPLVRVPDTGRLTAELVCHFHGQPDSIAWMKDGQAVQTDGNTHLLATHYVEPDTGVTRSRLSIMLVTAADYGTYMCRGRNWKGEALGSIVLTGPGGAPVTPGNENDNLTDCCVKKNVRPLCLVACSYDIDLTAIASPLECIDDIGKILHCGADGKDHRSCCRKNNVPSHCLPICAGLSNNFTNEHIECMLYATVIAKCMEQGQDNIPGRPLNVHVEPVNGMLLARWTPPTVNTRTVQYYVVHYLNMENRAQHVARVPADQHAVNLTQIYSLTEYWVNVTAGNHHTLGAPSETITITTPESSPSAPMSLRGTLSKTLGRFTVHLEWHPPVLNAGSVLHYIVFYTHVGDTWQKNIVLNSSQLQTDLTGVLDVETDYSFYVVAQSSHHRSAKSNVVSIYVGDTNLSTEVPTAGYPKPHSKLKTSAKVGIGIAVFIIGGLLLGGVACWYFRIRKAPKTQFEDTVAFENPGYARTNGPHLSGLPAEPAAEMTANGIVSPDDMTSVSFDVAGQKDPHTYTTLNTKAEVQNSYDAM